MKQNHEEHTKTATVWQDLFSGNRNFYPYQLSVSSLVKKDYEQEIKVYEGGSPFKLDYLPTDVSQAEGTNIKYLKGTAQWYRERNEATVKKKENLSNFLKKDARLKRCQRSLKIDPLLTIEN